MTEIRIYYEGHETLRQGFRKFLSELCAAARDRRCRVNLIATGGNPKQDYRDALQKHPAAWNVLLIDSDGPDDGALFATLKLEASHADSVFWMVQIMESWFLADIPTLSDYYGLGFNEKAVHGNRNIEEVPKQDVYEKLKAATRNTRKGAYHKTGHAPELLARLSPARVQEVSPNCRRMFDIISKRLSS